MGPFHESLSDLNFCQIPKSKEYSGLMDDLDQLEMDPKAPAKLMFSVLQANSPLENRPGVGLTNADAILSIFHSKSEY